MIQSFRKTDTAFLPAHCKSHSGTGSRERFETHGSEYARAADIPGIGDQETALALM
jgi:hypothetical protein